MHITIYVLEGIGIIEAKSEKDAYIQLFNKFAPEYIRCLLSVGHNNDDLALISKKFEDIKDDIINNGYNFFEVDIWYEPENVRQSITDIFCSNNEEEQNYFDNIKYKYLKKIATKKYIRGHVGVCPLFPDVFIKNYRELI